MKTEGTWGTESMKKESYEKVRCWFLKKELRIRGLHIVYHWLPRMVAASYPLCLALCFFRGREVFLKGFLVPAAVFLAATLFRRLIDCPRPYEVQEIQPLIPKDKKGQSFPSRHAVSAGIIAMAWGYLSLPAGIIFGAAAAAVAVSRVLAGVHFVRDAAAGLLFAAAAGIIGFYVI